MVRPTVRHLTFLALALLGSASAASAQRLPGLSPGDASTTTSAPAAPAVISASEVPTRADDDDRFVQDVLHRATRSQSLTALESRLVTLNDSVRAQALLFKDSELNTLPVTRLESIERHWHFFDRQYRLWQADLKQISDQTLGDSADLARRRSAWEALRAAPDADTLPSALVERVASVQAELAASENTLSLPLERQLRLGQRGNAVGTTINAGQRAIAAAIAFNDERLLRVDAAPIWTLRPQPITDADGQSLEKGLQIESEFAF